MRLLPNFPLSYVRWAFYICLAVVLVLALMPPRPMPTTGWDKANHVLAFAVLAVLGCRAYLQRDLRVLAFLLGYGCLIELLQGLTGYRSAEWLDVAADAIGLLVGWNLNRWASGSRSSRP
jgi:VanZ family protein